MSWESATLSLTLLAIDPAGLGGAVIRSRSGPVRDVFSEALEILPKPRVRLHPAMDDDTLFGGLDLTETLATGSLCQRAGLIEQAGSAILTMAERATPELAARLAQALDDGSLSGLVALDEGIDDEGTPAVLSERLAFRIELEMTTRDIGLLPDLEAVERARGRLSSIAIDEDLIETVVGLSAQLGISSARALLFAIRASRAHAALVGHQSILSDDIEVGTAFCLAHRATNLPPPPDEEESESPETRVDEAQADGTEQQVDMLEDRVLEAVMAMLPEGLLDQIRSKGSLGKGSGAGAKRKGNRRGRPKPSRPGRLSGQNRLDLIGTLRSAAPWQKLRGAEPGRVRIVPSDFRIKRYEDKSDRLLIFAVDASGSAAIARLGEAKGAVELLLSEAYSRRDHVSLIAFRGDTAETLLPPTRSLVQTKKRLAALPGGGGTPLAAGLVEGLTLATQARSHGMSPCIVLLTDGRANIALDGTPDRNRAGSDATTIAQQVRATGTDSIVLDLGKRPARFLEDLAHEMGGLYLPLPRADSKKMSDAVTSALVS